MSNRDTENDDGPPEGQPPSTIHPPPEEQEPPPADIALPETRREGLAAAAQTMSRERMTQEEERSGSVKMRSEPVSGPPPYAIPATSNERAMEDTDSGKRWKFSSRIEVGESQDGASPSDKDKPEETEPESE